ncbi:hypothetical protein EW146_g723 [Bondarzewia mesenterica]|uniref:CTLH domain-containing protein n=1 Tax=Bondarzewia mesenterica TaxID=1095465 RepID=A0A4S4M804_9AGAM|nr:hypothetical protein EW146_g723 [Bondarzewia mesenterica]
MNPTTQQLRALVLDYLCHNCYIRTARVFARDSLVQHLNADGEEVMRPKGEGDSVGVTDDDLEEVESRREVQQNLLSGHVDEATKLLNDRYPSVLPAAQPSSSTPPPHPTSAKLPSPHTVQIKSITPFSVEPTTLALELRILSFIETARTKPLDPSYSSHSQISDLPSQTDLSNIRPALPDTNADEHLFKLFQSARGLYAYAQELSALEDRVQYQPQLARISSLMAYKVPENSPVADYMTQTRRDQVADQINSAILYRTGHPAISYLELYIRYTTVIWACLSEDKVKVPSPANIPTGVKLPPRRRKSVPSPAPPPRPPTVDKEHSEIVPEFHLGEFLTSL